MKHAEVGTCTCASCTARAFQVKRKGHPFLPTSQVWVRHQGHWYPGKVAKLARVNIHVRYSDDHGRPCEAAVNPLAPDPRIKLRSIPYEEL